MADRWWRPTLAVAVLWVLLALPDQPGVLTPAGLARFPLELPFAALALAACPRPWAGPLRAAITAFLTATLTLKLADLAAETAFLRPFNPVLDRDLVIAAWRLGSGAVGWPLAGMAALALAGLIAAAGALAWWATGALAGLARPRRRPLAAVLAVAALGLVLADATGRGDPPGHARTAEMAGQHVAAALAARTDLAHFRAEAARDRWASTTSGHLLPELRGTDVIIVFVESYGRAALDNPLYAGTTRSALGDAAAEIAGAGLAARSGFLTAPMVGGQSWFAHASLLSGLTIDNEGKYRALLHSDRLTLLRLAQYVGWETAAVMPAITLAWPEAAWFNYDRVLAAKDLGYRGEPFGWVTMPDQYTLATLERELLAPTGRPPVMAEVALVSSHAPWTPLPPLLRWDEIGDGSVYTAALRSGDAPEVVWRDETRVRVQYRRAIDYSLRTVGSFAARTGQKPRLLVILGDHQPAAFVSEDPAGRDVPVHLVGPPDVIAHLDGWGWTEGMIPDARVPARPMADFRDAFLEAFEMKPTPGQSLPNVREVQLPAPLVREEDAVQ